MEVESGSCGELGPAHAGSGEPDLQIRFVCGAALDFDAIQSYIKVCAPRGRGCAWEREVGAAKVLR